MANKLIIFDIGGTSVKYATVDGAGGIANKGQFGTPWEDLSQMINIMQDICQTFIEQYQICGISISSAGIVQKEERLIGMGSKFYEGFGKELVSALEDCFGLPVSVENDANCAALAEKWRGNAQQETSFITLVFGTAIGGALMINGEIWRGTHNLAGEFGFALDKQADGHYSLWSTNNSTIGMVKRYARQKKTSNTVSGKDVLAAYHNGDQDAIDVYEAFCEQIAVRLYELQYYFDPSLILLGGGISSADGFIENVEKHLELITKQIQQTIIVPRINVCYFGNDANILGATYNWIMDHGEYR